MLSGPKSRSQICIPISPLHFKIVLQLDDWLSVYYEPRKILINLRISSSLIITYNLCELLLYIINSSKMLVITGNFIIFTIYR